MPSTIVTGPSEPLALISAVITTGTSVTEITTESVAVSVPLVQSRVKVTGEPKLGYQGCAGEIGPPLPEVEMPEVPLGAVSVQAVAPVELQL